MLPANIINTPDAATATADISKVFTTPNLSKNTPPTTFPPNEHIANIEPVSAITFGLKFNTFWK